MFVHVLEVPSDFLLMFWEYSQAFGPWGCLVCFLKFNSCSLSFWGVISVCSLGFARAGFSSKCRPKSLHKHVHVFFGKRDPPNHSKN